MIEEKEIYRQLQQRLDNLPVGFPPSESGVEIDLLKSLFTPEEAKIAIKLGFLPEPLKKIHRRVKKMGMSIDELEILLDKMIKKGLILGRDIYKRRGEGIVYGNALYAVGIHDYQLGHLTKEIAEAHRKYMDEVLVKVVMDKDIPTQIRTIPVEKSLTPEHHVGNYDNIRKLIENSIGPFAVMDCICRKSADLMGEPCKNTTLLETCVTMEEGALHVLYLGYAREIDKHEAIQILNKAQEEGLILQPTNAQKPLSVCACCGDCCHFLTAIKKLPRPVDYYTTNYYSEVDVDLCEGCGTCIEKCQMGALTLVDNVSQVNLDFCLGCGNCVSSCPSGAIHLVKKSKELVPPKDYEKLYIKILLKKKGFIGTLKTLGRKLLGMRI